MCICIYVYIMHCTTYIAQHIPYTLCVWHFTNNMCSCRLQTYLSLTSFFWLRVRGGSPLRALQVAACQRRPAARESLCSSWRRRLHVQDCLGTPRSGCFKALLKSSGKENLRQLHTKPLTFTLQWVIWWPLWKLHLMMDRLMSGSTSTHWPFCFNCVCWTHHSLAWWPRLWHRGLQGWPCTPMAQRMAMHCTQTCLVKCFAFIFHSKSFRGGGVPKCGAGCPLAFSLRNSMWLEALPSCCLVCCTSFLRACSI